MNMEKVDDPSPDIVVSAQLTSINKKLFELIQRIQKEDNRKESYAEL